jgi:DNA-binding transcriptional regulator LsrR (DeoR family)
MTDLSLMATMKVKISAAQSKRIDVKSAGLTCSVLNASRHKTEFAAKANKAKNVRAMVRGKLKSILITK